MADTVYLDNAATTFPKPESVYTFMDRFYRDFGVNVGRGQHKLAARASALVAETRSMILELNHALNKKVVLTHTATEALNVILQGQNWFDNANIYISPFEHNAVTRVLAYIQTIYKVNIIELTVNKINLTYDLEAINKQFREFKPDVVIVSHASNVCGVLAPIHEIFKLAKRYDAITVVDMAQTMGLVDTDIGSEIIDYAVFAGHKTLYGPFGIAGFICSATCKPKPLLFGGTGIDSANQSLPDMVPERYEIASPNIVAIAGLSASLSWIREIGIKQILLKEKNNHLKLLDALKHHRNIRVLEPVNGELSIGVVSCVFEGYGSDNIGQILSNHNIAVRTGLHCAPSAHRFLGTFPAGTVRFSVSYFNETSDFNILNTVLDYIEENS